MTGVQTCALPILAFAIPSIVAYKRCVLSEWPLNIRVASSKRAFASSIAFVPESAADRNARSHTRRILVQKNVRQEDNAGRNLAWIITFSDRHPLAQAVVAQGERGIGIYKSIPQPDFGKPCRCSTRAQETLIYCRALPVEG